MTNTDSDSISGLRVGFANISLLTRGGSTGITKTGITPIDLTLSNDCLNLYSLDNTLGTLSVFSVNPVNGQIVSIQRLTGLPVGASGIAAR